MSNEVAMLMMNPIEWDNSLNAQLGGSDAQARPNDPVDWIRYAAESEPGIFPIRTAAALQRDTGQGAFSPLQVQYGHRNIDAMPAGSSPTIMQINRNYSTGIGGLRNASALNPYELQREAGPCGGPCGCAGCSQTTSHSSNLEMIGWLSVIGVVGYFVFWR